jgi:hypothetical protein
MLSDDEAAQKARAEQLRKQIEQLTSCGEESDDAAVETEAPKKESPRDFIHRRMKELEQDEGTSS